MDNIILKRQIRIFITPLKHEWWILNITGKRTAGKFVTTEQDIIRFKAGIENKINALQLIKERKQLNP